MLGLALELQRRGHRITFATNQHFAGMAQKYGLPFEALGTEADFAACVSNPDLWHPQRAFRHVMQSLQPVLRQQYALHAESARAGDGIAITNCFGFGALMAQDKLQLPVITVHCQPAVLWSNREPPTLPGLFGPRWLKSLLYRAGERFVLDPTVCPFLNSWRRELDLPPVRRISRWWHSPYAVLCLFPDWYSPSQADWPRNIIQTDFPLWNDQSDAGLASDVDQFLRRGDPPLVFTPGSANVHGRQFFEASVEACRLLGRRGILLTEFPEQVPGPLPDTIAHFRYVPLDLLLPRSAAFIHHGGIGSTSQALLAGIPQLLMPLAHDQFDNAARIRKLGMGDWIPVQQFTGPRVSDRLRRLLAASAVAASCRTAAERLASRDGLHRSAIAIEEHVHRAGRDNPLRALQDGCGTVK